MTDLEIDNDEPVDITRTCHYCGVLETGRGADLDRKGWTTKLDTDDYALDAGDFHLSMIEDVCPECARGSEYDRLAESVG